MTTTAPKIEPLADVEPALGSITESLLISYAFDPLAATFTLVADYPHKAPQAQRSFIALQLSGVRDFYREAGGLAELQKYTSLYGLTHDPRSIVIQNISQQAHGDERSVELWFGPNFGGVRMSYDAVAAFVRHAVAEQRNGDWVYRDIRTNQRFDFEHPFAGMFDPI